MPQTDYWLLSRDKPTEVGYGVSKTDPELLQKQLGDMEGEMKEIQTELASIRKDRRDLHSKKNPKTTPIKNEEFKEQIKSERNRFPDDVGGKSAEISGLRADLSRSRRSAAEERCQREQYEERLKELEMKLDSICDIEGRREWEEEKTQMREQLRDVNEELEEVKTTLAEKTDELQEYRLKYLQAQQLAEELKRQLDVVELDNKQVTDQIHLEIHKMKMQFQEKLQELAPLPDVLKATQIQLHEARQLQQLAEESARALHADLQADKEKLVIVFNTLNQEKSARAELAEENGELRARLEEAERLAAELNGDVDDMKSRLVRVEEQLAQKEQRLQEKSLECAQLSKELDNTKQECSRSMSKCKERGEATRRNLQAQMSELERQLIQSRAQGRACQKERDEIRQRMQFQVRSLQENFEMVEMRLRALQGQVTSLKSSSISVLQDAHLSEWGQIITANS